jgi:hypothetical protein
LYFGTICAKVIEWEFLVDIVCHNLASEKDNYQLRCAVAAATVFNKKSPSD